MTPRQQVRDAIVAACPELLELSNGCKIIVSWEGDDGEEIIFSDRYMRDNGGGTVIEDNVVGHVKKVIGHEPRLTHVLRAIEKLGKEVKILQDGMIDNYHLKCHQEPRWPLLSDNLDDCDDKTIEVLHSILCAPKTR